MTTAVANFIEALLAHYPVRYDSEEREDAWVRSMTGALREYQADLLNDVAQDIIRTRKYRNFPLLSEILDKCEDIKKRREAAKREAMLPPMRPQEGDEWSTERCRLAHDLKHTELGRRAAKEGWIQALWHFCRRTQRLPEGHEIEQCRKNAFCLEEGLEMLAQIKPSSAMPADTLRALTKLGDSMIAKGKKLSDEVLGR